MLKTVSCVLVSKFVENKLLTFIHNVEKCAYKVANNDSRCNETHCWMHIMAIFVFLITTHLREQTWQKYQHFKYVKEHAMAQNCQLHYLCYVISWDQAMGWVTRVWFLEGAGTFLLATVSRPAMGNYKFPIQWVLDALSLGVKRLGHETNHSPSASAKVKNAWTYTSTHPICLHGMVLTYAQGQLYVYI